MAKHKLETRLTSETKRMKSKTKDIDVEIQPAFLDQIHFAACMYFIIWVVKKKEHAWMVVAKFNNFCQFDWNIVDLSIVKEIICSFWVSNVGSVLHGKQISLNFASICNIFKLLVKGIDVLARKTYNEQWAEYFEGTKDEHYKQDLGYIFAKVHISRMHMRLTALVKFATFR